VKRRKANHIQNLPQSNNIVAPIDHKQTDVAQYQKLNNLLQAKIEEFNNELMKVTQLNKAQAEVLMKKYVDQTMATYVNNALHEANADIAQKAEAYSQQLLLETMESLVEPVVSEHSTVSIKLKDDNLKGRIIGKDGRNRKAFKLITGVDIIIEQEPEITLSSPNPIRRELAYRVMNKLLVNRNIEPLRIQKVFEEENKHFEQDLQHYAKQALEDELQIYDVDPAMYPLIGRLYFRTSYGQNVLSHMTECAKVCQMLAYKLGLDPKIAKKVGFFHDIGKATDFEVDNDHVAQGLIIAKQYNLDPYIVDAIRSHHRNTTSQYVYSTLVKIADVISAGRPGARIDAHEQYVKRVTTMEELCLKHPGVTKAYALKAGRELMVVVEPNKIKEQDYQKLAYELKKELEANEITGKIGININIYRINTINVKTEASNTKK
jgi:ribonuclease Y